MPKNIVLFSDGTGNSSAKLFKTNVWRLYEATDLRRPDQIAYYDDGVGTSPFKPYALLGGALGLGLKRNVKHIYAFLCRNYEAGDRIYAFGFSRGAFTIRILIGLVHNQGLASAATESELWRLVEARWRAYRKHASIRYEEGTLYLSDLGSSNGTFRNDTRLAQASVTLAHGDVVRFGRTAYEVHGAGEPHVPAHSGEGERRVP